MLELVLKQVVFLLMRTCTTIIVYIIICVIYY
jgi:hypothetical protein